ncbi:MAG: hypothetical protein ACRCST_04760, partial [Turicibacter sp.]
MSYFGIYKKFAKNGAFIIGWVCLCIKVCLCADGERRQNYISESSHGHFLGDESSYKPESNLKSKFKWSQVSISRRDQFIIKPDKGYRVRSNPNTSGGYELNEQFKKSEEDQMRQQLEQSEKFKLCGLPKEHFKIVWEEKSEAKPSDEEFKETYIQNIKSAIEENTCNITFEVVRECNIRELELKGRWDWRIKYKEGSLLGKFYILSKIHLGLVHSFEKILDNQIAVKTENVHSKPMDGGI